MKPIIAAQQAEQEQTKAQPGYKCVVCGYATGTDYRIVGHDISKSPPPNVATHAGECYERWQDARRAAQQVERKDGEK